MKVEIDVKADDIVTWLNNDKRMREYRKNHVDDSTEYSELLRENIEVTRTTTIMIMELIDKATVNREIEREKAYAQTLGDNAINSSMQQFYDGMVECCNRLLNVLNTLEVKEVDLEKKLK